jgi:hypothetical protein
MNARFSQVGATGKERERTKLAEKAWLMKQAIYLSTNNLL